MADSGYGSEENYEYMFGNGMVPYVKYNMFHVEQRRKTYSSAHFFASESWILEYEAVEPVLLIEGFSPKVSVRRFWTARIIFSAKTTVKPKTSHLLYVYGIL